MNEYRPSLTRKLCVIAISILATMIAVIIAVILYPMWEIYGEGSEQDFWNLLRLSLDEVPMIVTTFCAGTLLGSPLVVRFGRISRLWPSALLATAAVGATVGLLITGRLDDLESVLDRPWNPASDLTTSVLVALAQVVNIALGCLLYRTARRYFRRGNAPEDPLPELLPSEIRVPRFGTHAEFRTLALILTASLLFAGGVGLAIREILAWPLPR